MSNGQKDTVYIDIDDEITAVIDKLHNSPHKIVALVLPKRAAVFQSIVNMKLLKRTADEEKKKVVLITSEAALLPLAGAVGLHVARTLQSKPEIPAAPSLAERPVGDSEEEPNLDENASVGKLAGLPSSEDETIEVDNSAEETSSGPPSDSKDAKKAAKEKKKRDKKLKIPNFEKFRTRLILGVLLLILLIGGWIAAFMVLPKAQITLKTDTNNLDTNLSFVADPKAAEFDQQNSILPATSKEFRKTDTEKVAATGQKDLGTKATGSVSLKNCSSSVNSITIPAGTTVSTSGLAFVTQEAVTLPASSFNGIGACITPAQSVSVSASNPGEQYNIDSGKTFAVSGYSSVSGTNSNAFTGGTSKIVKVVSQQDVDGAKQKIVDRASTEAPEELKKQLEEEHLYALTDTLTVGSPTMTSTPNVGDEASDVTVTSTTAFTMLGVKEDDLKKLIEEDAKKKIDTSKQMIRDNGLGSATIRVTEKKPDGKNAMSLHTVVVAGPQLDEAAIKQEIAGKKRGDATEIIKKRPGIRDVEISYSPFWVSKTPKSTSKITIIFEQADNGNNQNNP